MAQGIEHEGGPIRHHTPSVGEQIWSAALLGLLVVAPWPNGLASPWGKAIATAAMLLLAATVPRGRAPLPWRWIVAFCLITAPVALQVVPLPLPLLSVLAPHRAEAAAVVSEAARAVGLAPGTGLFLGGIPLSHLPYRTIRGLLTILASAAWIYCTAVYFSTRGRARPFLVAAALLGLLFASAVIAVKAGVLAPPVSQEGAAAELGAGTFVNKNHAGTLLAVLALIQAGGYLAGRRYHVAGLRYLFACGFVATVTGLFVGGSRGAQFAFLAGAVILAAGSVRGMRPIALLPLLIVLAAAPLVIDGGVVDDAETIGEPAADRSMDIREVIWRDSWRMARDHLPFGAGFANYGQLYPRYRSLRVLGRVGDAHNEPLQWLAEAGVIPMVALVGGIVALILFAVGEGRGSRSFRGRLCAGMGAAIGAAAIHSLVDFPLRNPAVGLWVMTAVGYLLSRSIRRSVRGTVTGTC